MPPSYSTMAAEVSSRARNCVIPVWFAKPGRSNGQRQVGSVLDQCSTTKRKVGAAAVDGRVAHASPVLACVGMLGEGCLPLVSPSGSCALALPSAARYNLEQVNYTLV